MTDWGPRLKVSDIDMELIATIGYRELSGSAATWNDVESKIRELPLVSTLYFLSKLNEALGHHPQVSDASGAVAETGARSVLSPSSSRHDESCVAVGPPRTQWWQCLTSLEWV